MIIIEKSISSDKESKKELEDDETPENPNENPPIENLMNAMEKLNLDSNLEANPINTGMNNPNLNANIPQNNQEDENFEFFKKNYLQSQNPNQKIKNNNIKKDAPSPLLNYYCFNESNESQQRSGENIYPMHPLPNMIPNMKINPMNQMLGMNPGVIPYSNIPYGNMILCRCIITIMEIIKHNIIPLKKTRKK